MIFCDIMRSAAIRIASRAMIEPPGNSDIWNWGTSDVPLEVVPMPGLMVVESVTSISSLYMPSLSISTIM